MKFVFLCIKTFPDTYETVSPQFYVKTNTHIPLKNFSSKIPIFLDEIFFPVNAFKKFLKTQGITIFLPN